jgi:hypothetical protein
MGINPNALSRALDLDLDPLSRVSLSLREICEDDPYAFAAASHLRHTLLKKYLSHRSDKAEEVAVTKFLHANKKCKNFRLTANTSLDEELIGSLREELYQFFFPESSFLVGSLVDIFHKASSGPGVSVGGLGTSFYSKYFSSKLTATSRSLYDLYRDCISHSPNWLEADDYRRDKLGDVDVVPGSYMLTVPKTVDEDRLICVEPSLNMFFQLGLGRLFEDRLRSYGVDLSSQANVNRRMAYQGSKDESLATIDLSSASDSISVNLLYGILPRECFNLLLMFRSTHTRYGDHVIPLHMISSMGNGFTFPLQTIIFQGIIRAVLRSYDVRPRAGVNYSVFGDDLIVPTFCEVRIKHLLSLCGFTLNSKKTFFQGHVRESCGADWFRGQPIRGVYLKKLDTVQDILIAINLLNQWTAYTGIPLRNLVQFLRGCIRGFIPLIPLSENMDAGVRVPQFYLGAVLKRDHNGSLTYRKFAVKPSLINVSDSRVHSREKRYKKLLFNPCGLYVSHLAGEVRDMGIQVRQLGRPSYKLVNQCCPNWDTTLVDTTNGVVLTGQQWETAAVLNWTNP